MPKFKKLTKYVDFLFISFNNRITLLDILWERERDRGREEREEREILQIRGVT